MPFCIEISFQLYVAAIYTRTRTPGNPFAFNPVTWNRRPDSSVVLPNSGKSAVVTNRMSMLGPPNVTDVTCCTGIGISNRILPSLCPNKGQMIKNGSTFIRNLIMNENECIHWIDFDDFTASETGDI